MKIFVLGYGYMGRIHTRVLSRMNLLGGIIELSDTLRELASKDYDCPIYASLDTAIENETIESIIIAVPTPFHNQLTMEVVEKIPNIKSLLVEKPIVATLAEFEENRKFWDSIQSKCVIGHIEVYNPVVEKFLEIIRSGEYGKIRTIAIQRKSAVQQNRLKSLSGVVEDVGIHDLDILNRLMPEIQKVYATGQKFNGKMNSVLAVVEGGDIQASLQFSREYSGRRRTLTIEMEKATIFVDLVSQTIEIRGLGEVIGENDMVRVPHGPGSSIKVYGEPLQEELNNLLNVGLGKASPKVGMSDGIKALRLADAIIQSIDTGNSVLL